MQVKASGKIWIKGEELTSMNEKHKARLRRQKNCIIYQFYNLIPILSVEKNIILPLSLDGRKAYMEKLKRLFFAFSEAKRVFFVTLVQNCCCFMGNWCWTVDDLREEKSANMK